MLHVEFYAEAGAVVGVEFSILEIETDGQVREGAALVVVLHQDGAGEGAERVDERGGCDGAGEVGDDADEVGFAESHDFEHLGDAANIGERGAKEVDGVMLDKGVEVPAVAPFFAGGRGER